MVTKCEATTCRHCEILESTYFEIKLDFRESKGRIGKDATWHTKKPHVIINGFSKSFIFPCRGF